MCHSTDSRPPAAPGGGTVAEHGGLELASADGTAFSAFQATPAEPNGMNVVILPDVRGVHPYYQDLAKRFAEAGFHTVAIDYYGRTAGVGERDDEFDWEAHLPKVEPGQVAADVSAAAAHLAERNPGPVFTVGFCFGGSQSWRLSAADLDLAGVIGFYGQPKHVRDVLDKFSKPALLLIAGNDVATSKEEFDEFTAALDADGKTYEKYVYDGAPHSFFDRAFGEWQSACEDAWQRVLDFTERYGAKAEVAAGA
ncbi:MAG TPA: dienelactone hydrolase family protein [Amycolatopsis sp.]|uniref:dienelactone hydrolase family protein n=1 Tax=Amycolatopsis sp. TaxID=37632 RepID=UPI002B48F224|nr:dienelactone hydrolase family protein [Amycolatopsis sp.]HKS50142.1 dienelactone hydrolase family protein [Amycolatopsis sp.]